MGVRTRLKTHALRALRPVVRFCIDKAGIRNYLREGTERALADHDIVLSDTFPGEYADVIHGHRDGNPGNGERMVFVTSRFRTGSTLLWRIVRQLPEVTAYYEPFHHVHAHPTRVSSIDKTHRGVNDYWSEYRSLEGLSEMFDPTWSTCKLYLDERHWMPRMRAYLDRLAAAACARSVFQFNRADFRLGWLRHQYPAARIVHLYRHPRDQWSSTLRDHRACPAERCAELFSQFDRYQLHEWCLDLRDVFPLLRVDLHPYEQFYLLWRLSFMFGSRYADHSLSYEQLVAEPRKAIKSLCDSLGFSGESIVDLSLIDTNSVGRWREYAPADWFEEKEKNCEVELGNYLAHLHQRPVKS